VSNPGGGLTLGTPSTTGGFTTVKITAGSGNIKFS
jgi:hypothetical protein